MCKSIVLIFGIIYNQAMKERKTINRDQRIVRTSIIGIGGNVVLVGFKAFIGFLAGSVSIIMDALNNLTDALSSVLTIVGTKLSGKRPNKKHPYGYGRIEYLTSMIIGALILFAGGSAIYESIRSIVDYFQTGTMANYDLWAFVIVGVAIVVKILLGLFFRWQGKIAKSENLKASGMDALWDALLSLATLIGAFVNYFWHFYVEGYLGILIGIFIIKSGIEVLSESLNNLIGRRIVKDFAQQLKSEIGSIPGVYGVYDLLLNSYGENEANGSVHIEVKDDATAKEIEQIERQIQALVYEKHRIIMTIGIYAQNQSTPLSVSMKSFLIEWVKKNPNFISLHAFSVDEERKLVHFDLVLSFEEKDPEGYATSLKETLEEKYEGYQFSIVLDRDYTD